MYLLLYVQVIISWCFPKNSCSCIIFNLNLTANSFSLKHFVVTVNYFKDYLFENLILQPKTLFPNGCEIPNVLANYLYISFKINQLG